MTHSSPPEQNTGHESFEVVATDALRQLLGAISIGQNAIKAAESALSHHKLVMPRMAIPYRCPKARRFLTEQGDALFTQLKYELEKRALYAEYRTATDNLFAQRRTLTIAHESLRAFRAAANIALKCAYSVERGPTAELSRSIDEADALSFKLSATKVDNQFYTESRECKIPDLWYPDQSRVAPFFFGTTKADQPRTFSLRVNKLEPPYSYLYQYATAIAPYDDEELCLFSPGPLRPNQSYLTRDEATNLWMLYTLGMAPERLAQLKPHVVDVQTGQLLN